MCLNESEEFFSVLLPSKWDEDGEDSRDWWPPVLLPALDTSRHQTLMLPKLYICAVTSFSTMQT